jgi:hypothetical protein
MGSKTVPALIVTGHHLEPGPHLTLHRRRQEHPHFRMSPDGSTCEVVVTQPNMPAGTNFLGSNFIAWDSTGKMWVSDNSRRVYGFTVSG